jgi:hypothetical protein
MEETISGKHLFFFFIVKMKLKKKYFSPWQYPS